MFQLLITDSDELQPNLYCCVEAPPHLYSNLFLYFFIASFLGFSHQIAAVAPCFSPDIITLCDIS